VSRRRGAAELLTKLIEGIPGVKGPHVPANTRHSYWLYFLRVAEPENGRRTQRIGDALVAEGVPAWVRYIVDPLYLSPLFTEPATYGSSGYPFSAFGAQRFERGLCPNAESALDSVIAIHWNENFSDAQIQRIAAAIRHSAKQ
jgi:dTDP-4-amino-4,6-dideoxygalactose transaminase